MTTTTTSTSTNSPLDQLAPLVLVLFVPLLVLYGQNYFSQVAFHMISVASSALPWNWSSIYEHGSVISKPQMKNLVRTRAEQLAARTDGRPGASPIKHCNVSPRQTFESIIFKSSMMHQKEKRVCSTPVSLIFPAPIAS